MEANELRIGNLVDAGGRIGIVERIEKDGVLVRIIEGDTNELIEHEIKPILITEEWLVNFGFENCLGESKKTMKNPFENDSKFEAIIQFSDGDDFASFIINETGKSLGQEHSSFVPFKIKHVNQLQNLYHALTGEELTIKE